MSNGLLLFGQSSAMRFLSYRGFGQVCFNLRPNPSSQFSITNSVVASWHLKSKDVLQDNGIYNLEIHRVAVMGLCSLFCFGNHFIYLFQPSLWWQFLGFRCNGEDKIYIVITNPRSRIWEFFLYETPFLYNIFRFCCLIKPSFNDLSVLFFLQKSQLWKLKGNGRASYSLYLKWGSDDQVVFTYSLLESVFL